MARTRAFAITVAGCALLLLLCPARSWAQESAEELQQLVAPVALYPDELLAEILAAATYPSQVDDAARWLQQNASLTSDQIAGAVDAMAWDPSVKALTEFPTVLANMAQNLSWTSALGDAYYNQPDDVMDAVQGLREQAIAAGALQSNSQIIVTSQDGIIVIEPVDAGTVYVPSYDCWTVYGAPIRPWPGFFFVRGLGGGPRVSWSLSFRTGGAWGRESWSWHNWAFDWRDHRVAFHREDYVSHSLSVVDRHYTPRPGQPVPGGRAQAGPGTEQRLPQRPPSGQPPAGRGPVAVPRQGGAQRGPVAMPPATPGQREPAQVPHPAAAPPPKPAAPPAPPANPKNDRGFAQPRPTTPPSGTRSGALSGFKEGGTVSGSSARGQASLGVRPPPPPPSPPPSRQSAPPPRPAPAPPADRGRGGRGRGRL